MKNESQNLTMTFTPYSCSTPKFMPVINQPLHFVLAAPIEIQREDKQRQLVQSTDRSHCRPLKKCQRYRSKQANASIAINRQHHFDMNTTIQHNQQHIFFCLPLKFFQITKFRRHRRHAPCYV